MSKYYVEYGALQANAERLIECDTSALPAKKITEELAVKIADALNRQKAEEGAEATGDSQVIGNAAAMREALSDACYAMFNFLKTQSGGYEEMANALDKAKAALAKPPRNCDVGTADEQEKRYKETTQNVYHTLTLTKALSWAQMPYESEAAK